MRYSEMGSGGMFPYPNHNQDPKVKQEVPEKFLLPYAKATYSDWSGYPKGMFANNNGDYEKYRLYALGKQPITPYKKWLGVEDQTDNTWLAVDWSVRPIVSTYRDKAISRLMEQEHGIVATPIDSLARTEMQDYINEMKAKMAVRQLIAQTNSGLKNHPLISLSPDDPTDEEELEMRIQMGEQFLRSMDAEKAIELGFYENDYKHFRKSVYEDLFDFGVAGYKQWLGDDNKAKFRKVNPENIVTNFCRESNFRSWGENPDLIHAGEMIDVPLVELATLVGKDGLPLFDEKTLTEFAESIRNKWGNPKLLNNSATLKPYDKFKCKVLDLELFSYDDLVYKTAPDSNGNLDLRKADYFRKSEKYSRKKIRNVYKVKWIVGTDRCYDFGLCYDQLRPADVKKKAQASLSFRFIAYNFYEMKAQGFMERLVPYLDDYQLTMLKIQNFKNRAVPSGWWIDLDALANVAKEKGGKNMKPLELLRMFMDTGVILGRSRNDAGEPLFVNSQPIIPLNNTAAAELAMFFQDLVTTIQAIERLTGFNDTTMGQAPQKMLVPGLEAAQISTTHALFPLFYAETLLSEKLAEDVHARMKQGIQKTGVLSGYAPALNTNTLRFIQLDQNLLRDCGIKLEIKTSDEMKMWVLQQMQGDIANGLLDTSDAILILNTHNVKQSMMILQHRVKKAKEMAQQQKMQELQANNEGQLQLQQQAAAAEQQKMQFEAQVELQKQQIVVQGEVEKERIRQQTELEKERLRLMATMQKTEADNQTKVVVAQEQSQGKIAAAHVSGEKDIEKTELAGQHAIEKQRVANAKPQPKSSTTKK